jgi:hypothetical protein
MWEIPSCWNWERWNLELSLGSPELGTLLVARSWKNTIYDRSTVYIQSRADFSQTKQQNRFQKKTKQNMFVVDEGYTPISYWMM